jgi:hypothetical protein
MSEEAGLTSRHRRGARYFARFGTAVAFALILALGLSAGDSLTTIVGAVGTAISAIFLLLEWLLARREKV